MNTTPTTNGKPTAVNNLSVCAVCKTTGKNGANWLLSVEGKGVSRVHKPCGDSVLSAAPQGVKATLEPAREQRELWRKEREARLARGFWDKAFAQAKPLSPKASPAETPAPVSA